MNKKIKVLAYLDAPSSATGFSTVSRNILMGLHSTGRYEIEVLGINYYGDPHNFPFKIWPVAIGDPKNDPYGRTKVFNMIRQMEFDILFFLQDTFILDFVPELISHLKSINKKFKSIVYYPIDGRPKTQWINNIKDCDYIVAYTEFGKALTYEVCPAIKNKEILVIPHGVNTKEYFPIENTETLNSFRKQYFGANYDKFIYMNLNRNQRRKDIPRTIHAFNEVKKIIPSALLYLHCASLDQGWDLKEVCKYFNLSTERDVIFPVNFGPNQGFPREIVNYIYNSVDCVVSTATGEGFGLSFIESMATKTPVIMPNNTSLTELILPERGYLVNSGSNLNLFTVLTQDNDIMRPLVDVEDLIDKMLHVYNNKNEVATKVNNAYEWVTNNMDWMKHIVPIWISLFDKAYGELSSINVAKTNELQSTTIMAEVI